MTITGSVANIIVVERARPEVAIGFREYFRAGLPVTLATLDKTQRLGRRHNAEGKQQYGTDDDGARPIDLHTRKLAQREN